MKTVVITGSASGLGFEMAKCFRKENFNVVICDVNEEKLKTAKEELLNIKSKGDVLALTCNITKEKDINALIDNTINKFKSIDIWVNNAGVNQPEKALWELNEEEIDTLLDIDLKGTIMCSNAITRTMIKDGHGAIYNVEGHGSNDAIIYGLSMYGTSKRAVTYFTDALAKECAIKNNNIIVGKLSPGIMITRFITSSLNNDGSIKLSDKNKMVYNILGDYPDVVANYLVSKMIINKKNGVKIDWLPNWKAAYRFATSSFNKRNFFENQDK